MATVSQKDRKARARAAILKVKLPVVSFKRAVARLEGIVNGWDKDSSADDTIHRLQSIVGYRKHILKMAAVLYGTLAHCQETLDSLE